VSTLLKKVAGIAVLATCLLMCCGCQVENDVKDPWQRIDELFSAWDRDDGPGCALGVIAMESWCTPRAMVWPI